MYQVGERLEDTQRGATLIVEAVEKDHLLCKVDRPRRQADKPVRREPRGHVTRARQTRAVTT
jgi:hypothetical protein